MSYTSALNPYSTIKFDSDSPFDKSLRHTDHSLCSIDDVKMKNDIAEEFSSKDIIRYYIRTNVIETWRPSVDDNFIENEIIYSGVKVMDSLCDIDDLELATVKTLSDYVEEFSSLTKNWDGYGAIPIYPNIIKKVQWFFRVVPNRYLDLTDIGKISPDTNGTITIDFENENNGILSISFGLEHENFYYDDIDDITIDESESIYINPDLGIPKRIIDSLENLKNSK